MPQSRRAAPINHPAGVLRSLRRCGRKNPEWLLPLDCRFIAVLQRLSGLTCKRLSLWRKSLHPTCVLSVEPQPGCVWLLYPTFEPQGSAPRARAITRDSRVFAWYSAFRVTSGLPLAGSVGGHGKHTRRTAIATEQTPTACKMAARIAWMRGLGQLPRTPCQGVRSHARDRGRQGSRAARFATGE